VLRPADKNDLDGAGPKVAAVLKHLPPDGYVSAGELEESCGRGATLRMLEWACESGILRKMMRDSDVMGLKSVRFWLAQLNPPQMKRFHLRKGTRRTYVDALEAFNRWLPGKRFPAVRRGRRAARRVGFSDVEELLQFCEDPEQGSLMARRVARQYLADLATSGHSLPAAMVRCAALKSYLAAHDIRISLRVDRRRHVVHDVRDPPEMGLFDLYKMMTTGGMDVMLKAIVMIKFQAGLDASTLADRFNFEAYPQIVRRLGIEDYEAWDLGRCPVPVRLVRVKTGTEYTTFLDRDAVSHLRDYLRWKESREGKRHDPSRPLFVTSRGTPVSPNWISSKFSRAAANAGIQKKTSRMTYKIHSHEVRDLLKSTLLVSGCAQYAADHVLGHAPRDSYEKQATLYPEKLREEYAKASGRLNIFTSIERHLKGEGDGPRVRWGGEGAAAAAAAAGGDHYQRTEAQKEIQDAFQKMTGVMADMFRIVSSVGGGGIGGPDAAPDDVVRRLMGLKGGGEEEE